MKKGFVFLILVILVISCKREPVSWDVDTLFPILKTQMSIQQAIPDSLIEIKNTNELHLVYRGSLIDFKLDSALTIPDTTTTDEFSLPFDSITLQPGQVFFTDSNFARYEIGDYKLSQIEIETGQIILELSSALNEASIIEYSFPTITKAGIPLFIKEKIPAGSVANPSSFIKSIDLSGYTIALTGINNDNYNIIATFYKAYVDPAGSAVKLIKSDYFSISTTMFQIQPSYIRGSFGTELKNETAINDPIDAFKNIGGGSIDLDEVSLIFQIQNEVGADISLSVNQLKGKNTFNNTEVELISPMSTKTINLNRATEDNGVFSNPIATSYNLIVNKSNSNVTEFVSNLPNQMSYDFDIKFNPIGNVSNNNDFLYINTGVSVNLDAEIPLNFRASNLIIIDTSDFTIDSTSQEDASRIKDGFINLYAQNWYPFDLTAQFYLLNEDNQIIDSVFSSSQTLKGAIPKFGIVDAPFSSTLQSPINEAKVDRLYQTKSIITQIRINSTTTDTIQILDYYNIDLKLVGDFKYLISIP
jgi:hypothetical protein